MKTTNGITNHKKMSIISANIKLTTDGTELKQNKFNIAVVLLQDVGYF